MNAVAQIIPLKRGPLGLPFLDYAVPETLANTLSPGQLVAAPFRRGEMYGIVKTIQKTNVAAEKLRPLAAIVSATPLFAEPYLAFLDEVAERYHVSLGFLIKSALFPITKKGLKELAAGAPKKITAAASQKPSFSAVCYRTIQEQKELLSGALSATGQTLIIAPTIKDVREIVQLLPQGRAAQTEIIHSDLTDPELRAAWLRLWRGERQIAVGTWRAVFLPWHNLASIIISDEGNQQHKNSDMAPRFHARDAAEMLARVSGADVHLGGPSLSVETYAKARAKNPSAPIASLLPAPAAPYMVDISAEAARAFAVSLDVETALKETTGSVFLFVNRRGRQRVTLCADCGTIVRCPVCQESLTYHARGQHYICHRCRHSEPPALTCKKCAGTNFRFYGFGTEQVAEHVRALLKTDPRKIVLIDSDRDIPTFSADEKYIIIGTIRALPFLPWDTLALVAFLDADTPLLTPEYQAAEQLWHTIHTTLFRLPKDTPVYIQTAKPNHPLFAGLAAPGTFYDHELKTRQTFGYPPYTFLIKVLFPAKKSGAADVAKQLTAKLSSLTRIDKNITITKPLPLFPAIRGELWYSSVIKVPPGVAVQCLKALHALALPEWKIDPHPTTLFT